MIIPIRFPASSSGSPLPPGLAEISHNEVVLIELQGSLEVECNDDSERNGRLVGKLTLDSALTKPTLMIGHHLLEGKIANLSKPLAVLLRAPSAGSGSEPRNPPHSTNHLTPPTADSEAQDRHSDCDIEMADREDTKLGLEQMSAPRAWDVIAVVKRKIVFSKRPMPIVGAK